MSHCSIEACDKAAFCRGWCSAHYSRWQRHGDPNFVSRTPPMHPSATHKWCSRCKTERPISDFGLRVSGRLKGYCKPCDREYADAYARTEAGKAKHKVASAKWSHGPRKEYDLMWRYGLTLTAYEAMRSQQGDRCAICGAVEPGGKLRRWCVDHCHTTNIVRGLLCIRCNLGIGKFGDDPKTLRAAADYLESRTPPP